MQPKILSPFVTSVLLASTLTATAATFTWDGGGADNKFGTAENWDPDAPITTVNGQDILIGVGPQNTADVNIGGNFSSLFFSSGASAMTLTASANNMQFATGTLTQIQNNSANAQYINATVRPFWIGASANRTWNAASGNLTYQAVLMRSDSIFANSVTLTFAGNFNHTVNTTMNLESPTSWYGKTAGVIKTGTGTLLLSGGGNYNGTVSINGGTLKIGNATSLGFGSVQTTANGVTTVASGFTLDLNGTSGVNEVINLNGTGIGGNGALVNNSVTPASIGTGIAGLTTTATGTGSNYSSAPAIVISGTGTGATATAVLGLTNASINSASGGTGWVTGDTVNITGGGGTGAIGTVTASGGVIISVTITNSGVGYTSSPNGMTKRTSATGAGTLVLSGNASNFTVAGMAVNNAGSGYTGTPTITFAGVTQTPVVALASVNLSSHSSIGGSGDIAIAPVVSGAFNMTKVGAGVLTLSGANTYSGKTIISGGVIRVQNSSALGTSAVVEAQSTSIESGTALEIDGSLTTTEFIRVTGTGIGGNGAIRATSGTSNLNSQIAMEGTGGVTVSFGVDSGATLKVSRLYSDPGRDTNFEKVGAGTLVLKADNSDDYVGNTTITGGTLQVGDGSTTGELKSTGVTNNSNLSFNRTNVYDYTGAITGSGALTQAGSGTLTLSGGNSYAGTTTISAGTLRIGAGGATGTLGGGNVTNNSILEFSRSNAMTVTNGISGTGTIYQTGAGATTLDPGAGSYSIRAISANGGNLTLKSGTFATTGVDPFNGAYTVGAGARGGTLTIDGATLNVGGGRALKVGASVNGNLELKSGTVTANDLVLGHNGTSVGTQSGGDATVINLYHQDGGNGSSYTLTGGSMTAKRIFNNTASANDFTLNLNGGTLYSAAGTINLIDDGGRGGAEITVLLGTGNTVIDTTSSSATIVRPMGDMPSVAGAFTKDGANTLTLAGTNTYTGATTVLAGTLVIGSTGSLDNTAVTVGGAGASGTPTLGGVGTIGGNTLISAAGGGAAGTHAPGLAGVSGGVGTQAFSGDLSYGGGSIFEWDINDNSTSIGFDKVTVGGAVSVGTGATFAINLGDAIFTGGDFVDTAFWKTPYGTQTWAMSDIFSEAFSYGAFTNVSTVQNVSTFGSFTISGSSLTWTAVPEPTSALAGLLLTAGLLRRRRSTR